MREEAALFKALSDPIRLRLAVLLASRGETNCRISLHSGIFEWLDGSKRGARAGEDLDRLESEKFHQGAECHG